MADDDRDLAGRFAAVDAEPHADWVAALRADLEVGFDVGELPQRLAVRRVRRPRRVFAFSVALGVAATLAVLVVVLLQRDPTHEDPPLTAPTTAPATVLTTVPTAPATSISPTTAPATTALPPTTARTCTTDRTGVATANALVFVEPASIWRVLPEPLCLQQRSAITGILIEERDLTTRSVIASRSVKMEEIRRVAGGTVIPRLAMYPARSWEGLSLVGIAGREVVLKTSTGVVGIDIDSGTITAVTLDDPNRIVGVVGTTILAINAASVDRLDLHAGTAETLATPGVAIPDAKATSEGVWFWSNDASEIVRVAADGTIHRLEQFTGTVVLGAFYPAPGSLWAVVAPAGIDPNDLHDPSNLPGATTLMRLDPADGHALVTVPPQSNPSGSSEGHSDSTGFLALLGQDNSFDPYVTRVFGRWLWVNNDGTVVPLAPPTGVTVLGVAGGRIVGYDAGFEVVTLAVGDLKAG